MRRLKRKGLKSTVPLNPLLTRPNQEWALDFVSDALSNGRALRAAARERRVHLQRQALARVAVDPLKIRNLRPLAATSLAKSIAHS